MCPVLVSIRREFHAYERLQRQDSKRGSKIVRLDVWRGFGVFASDLFICKDHMDRISCFCSRSVKKHVDTGRVSINEADGFEGELGGLKISATNQNVNILRVSHGRYIDTSNPDGNGIAADNRIRHILGVQSTRCSHQSIAYIFHGTHHPVQNEFACHCLHDEYRIRYCPNSHLNLT